MPSRSANSDDTVQVGRIGRPHGIHGAVRVENLSDVEDRFSKGAALRAVDREGRTRTLRIVSVRDGAQGLLIRFDGIADRDAAERLRGQVLEIDAADVPAAPEGLYYHFELIGCTCRDQQLGDLGEVTAIHEDGGGWMLEVKSASGRLLVPFVKAFGAEVDVAARLIEVDLPPGLVETCTSKS